MIIEEKNKLRRQVKDLKSKLTEVERQKKSAKIFLELEQLEVFKQAKTILLYWSMNDEVFTPTFIDKWWKEKTILLPVVNGDNMEIKIYAGKSSMTPGERFGILEPTGDIFTDFNTIDLIVTPGIAFDKNNFRMGRGKGYYDKFLSQCVAHKLGVCYNFQVFDSIPTEQHDIPMNVVISA